MGNLCSTPSTTCCKRPCPFSAIRRHARGCKRIKYTLVPRRDPDRQRRRNAALANNHHNGGSPNTLHRSNAIRRPGRSRSQSSSPNFGPRPSRLQIRNMTPPPLRPSSIAPTLMVLGTPSTGPPTSISRSSRTAATNSTSPTSPATIVSSPYNYSSSSGSANNGRPRTLYMVDGEVIGGDEERLELRWIDALRAPGVPGGYRTVVDVVEERRSGRLTVVNGGGRGSEDSERMGPLLPSRGFGGDSVDGIFAPRVEEGRGSYRNVLEERSRQRRQRQKPVQQSTPVRKNPVPADVRMNTADEESPLASRSNAPLPSNAPDFNDPVTPPIDTVLPLKFRWRRGPPSRPPIPTFKTVGVTEKELLDEVEDARRILERKDLREEDEKRRSQRGEEGKGKEDKRKEVKEEEEGDTEGTMDFFWVDDEGCLVYRRCELPV
ncbi:MAG: hypothetical protein Q9172_004058 [Xanthocarpia lactea]